MNIHQACISENGGLKVEFWGKSIYNFAANSQSPGHQKAISNVFVVNLMRNSPRGNQPLR